MITKWAGREKEKDVLNSLFFLSFCYRSSTIFGLFLRPCYETRAFTRRKQAILLSQGSHALSQNVSKVYFLFPKLGKRTWFPVHVVWETSTWLSSVALNFLVLSHLLDRFTNPISALKLIKKCQNYLEIFSREKVSGSLRPKFIWGRVWAYDRNFNEFDFRFSSHFPLFLRRLPYPDRKSGNFAQRFFCTLGRSRVKNGFGVLAPIVSASGVELLGFVPICFNWGKTSGNSVGGIIYFPIKSSFSNPKPRGIRGKRKCQEKCKAFPRERIFRIFSAYQNVILISRTSNNPVSRTPRPTKYFPLSIRSHEK